MRTATELLDAAQYKHLAEVLHQVQLTYDKKGDTIPAHVLVLARRICLACSQSQAEADWHQQACQEAAQREDKLRHQLSTLLDLVSERDLPAIPGKWDFIPDAAPAVLGPPGPELPGPAEPLSLWQRIQGALHWRLGPPPVEGITSEAPVQGLSPRSPLTIESRVPFSVKTDEIPPEAPAIDLEVQSPEMDEEVEIPTASDSKKGEAAVRQLEETLEPPAPSEIGEGTDPLSPLKETGTETKAPTGETEAELALHTAADVPIPSSAEEGTSQDSPQSEKFEKAETPAPPAVEEAQVPIREPVEEPQTVREPTEESDLQILLSIESVEKATPTSVAGDTDEAQGTPSLAVHCLGPFRVYQDDQPVEEWPSSKGKSIFKYLAINRTRPVPKEVLMELLWPGAHPDAARNNLNVAIYGLRRALRKTQPRVSHVLFQDDCYLLNPELRIWVDVEAFAEHAAAARDLELRIGLAAAMRKYGAAEALYQGDFLEEDRYEDWPIPQRQSLRDEYLGLLERQGHYYLEQEDYAACATACRKMLALDACCEEAYRRLMRCYSRLGQHFLALRQFHLCEEMLAEQLDLAPASRTMRLYHRVRSRDDI